MDTKLFDIEKTFREVIMGEEPTVTTSEYVGRIGFNPKACNYELQKRLDERNELLLYIRNNWDKEDFDGEEMDRKIDDLLGKIG